MFYYLNCFFIYSILGFLLETICSLIGFGGTLNSGIFYGPWTPVYGIGSIIIITISKYLFKNIKVNKWLNSLILFIVTTIILSLIEWLGGFLIEYIFHTIFWDYSNHAYHIGKYVALDMSIMWGIASVFFVYIIHPQLKKIIKKIPYSITCIFITLFIIDVILTFMFKFH